MQNPFSMQLKFSACAYVEFEFEIKSTSVFINTKDRMFVWSQEQSRQVKIMNNPFTRKSSIKKSMFFTNNSKRHSTLTHLPKNVIWRYLNLKSICEWPLTSEKFRRNHRNRRKKTRGVNDNQNGSAISQKSIKCTMHPQRSRNLIEKLNRNKRSTADRR